MHNESRSVVLVVENDVWQ